MFCTLRLSPGSAAPAGFAGREGTLFHTCSILVPYLFHTSADGRGLGEGSARGVSGGLLERRLICMCAGVCMHSNTGQHYLACVLACVLARLLACACVHVCMRVRVLVHVYV